MRKVRDGRRGDDSGIFDGRATSVEASRQRRGNPLARLTGVHSHQDAGCRGCGFQGVRKSEADGVDGGGIQRGLASDGANAVGAEELLHLVTVSVMVARTLPRANRARIF